MSERVDRIIKRIEALEKVGAATFGTPEAYEEYKRHGGVDGEAPDNQTIQADMQSIDAVARAAASKEEARGKIVDALTKSLSEEQMKEFGTKAPLPIRTALIEFYQKQAVSLAQSQKFKDRLVKAGIKLDAKGLKDAVDNGSLGQLIAENENSSLAEDKEAANYLKDLQATFIKMQTGPAEIQTAVAQAATAQKTVEKTEAEKVRFQEEAKRIAQKVGPLLATVGITDIERALTDGSLEKAVNYLAGPNGRNLRGESLSNEEITGLQNFQKLATENYILVHTKDANIRKANADAITAEQTAEQSVVGTNLMHAIVGDGTGGFSHLLGNMGFGRGGLAGTMSSLNRFADRIGSAVPNMNVGDGMSAVIRGDTAQLKRLATQIEEPGQSRGGSAVRPSGTNIPDLNPTG